MKIILADPHGRKMSKSELIQFLSRPNILRLAYIGKSDQPYVHPVWYHFFKGKFVVTTDISGAKARAIRKNPFVYFLVDESSSGVPTRGVRGPGLAKVVYDPAYATKVTRRNVKRYFGTLTSKAAKMVLDLGPESCIIEITPRYMASWKF